MRGPGERRRFCRSRAAALATVGVVASLLFSLGTPVAQADLDGDKARIDRELADLHAALEGTSADLVKAYRALHATEATVPDARAALADAQAKAAEAARHNEQVATQLAVAQANEARAVEEQQQTSDKIEETQRELDVFAADLFQGGAGENQLAVALGATNPDDFVSRIASADIVSSFTTKTLDDLATARAEADASHAYLAAVNDEITELKRQAEAALADAESQEAEAQAAKVALDTLLTSQQTYAAEVEARKADELTRMAAAEAEQAELAAQLAERARLAQEAAAQRAGGTDAQLSAPKRTPKTSPKPASPPPPSSSSSNSRLSRPMPGRISSGFGWRMHPILKTRRLHRGLDLAAPCGTAIKAAAGGTVISARWAGAYGNRVMVDHGIVRGKHVVTTYNHLGSFAVRSGQSVRRGQVIGYEGTTGRSTGCHLHFETIQNGVWVNPLAWL